MYLAYACVCIPSLIPTPSQGDQLDWLLQQQPGEAVSEQQEPADTWPPQPYPRFVPKSLRRQDRSSNRIYFSNSKPHDESPILGTATEVEREKDKESTVIDGGSNSSARQPPILVEATEVERKKKEESRVAGVSSVAWISSLRCAPMLCLLEESTIEEERFFLNEDNKWYARMLYLCVNTLELTLLWLFWRTAFISNPKHTTNRTF